MSEAPELPPEELRTSTLNHNAFHRYVNMDGGLSMEGIAQSAFGLAVFAQAVSVCAHDHGWWSDDDGNTVERNFGEMIALMHSELSEALEAWRDHDVPQQIRYEYKTEGGPQVLYAKEFVYSDHVELGKPVGVASEMADVIIRILDTCVALDIPIVDALLDKHAYNLTRPYRHGGKKA